jgi:hypothetical protein
MRAFLWCNGELHDENLTSKFEDISPLFGVDGGANKAKSVGYNVKEILGDLDSVNIEELNIDGTLLKDQNYSDAQIPSICPVSPPSTPRTSNSLNPLFDNSLIVFVKSL